MDKFSDGEMKTFMKRAGTTNKGNEYEDLLVGLLAFRLSEDDQVQNFNLSSNSKGFGKLDDIVINVTYNNQKTELNYVVQVKHKEKGKRVSTEMLAADEGPFSIQQYFKCYQEIKHRDELKNEFNCILYTNALFEVPENSNFKLKTGDIELTLRQHKLSKEEDFLNTSGNDFVYKFEVQNGQTNDEYETFFDHFLFYPNQKYLDEMKVSISQQFQDTYFCKEDAFVMYMDYINNWSKREGRKNCLNKNTVNIVIGEILLRPYGQIHTFFRNNCTLQLFKEACLECDITLIESGRLKSHEVFTQTTEKIKKPLSEMVEEYHKIGSLEEDKMVLALWNMNQAPFVIEVNESNKKAIYRGLSLFKRSHHTKRTFLLIGENMHRDDFSEFKVFQNLNDLRFNSTLYDKFVESTKISFQGREAVSLKTVIGDDEEMAKAITTCELLHCNSILVGEEKEDLPPFYIDRFLSRTTIDFKFINDFVVKGVSVINCNQKAVENITNTIALGTQIMPVEEYLKKNEDELLYSRVVVVAEDVCTTEQFHEICKKSKNKTCHLFRVDDQMNLEWINGNGNPEEFKTYLKKINYRESDIFKVNDKKVHLICAKPGAGKSVLLRYLKNNIPSEYWIVKINCRDHSIFFKNVSSDLNICHYLLEFQAKEKNYGLLEVNLRKVFRNRQKIVFLWDALDELPRVCLPKVVKAISELADLGFVSWATARDYLRSALEERFGIYSLILEEINSEQQELYIRTHLQSKHDSEDLKIIIRKIREVIAITADVGFLGVPLRIYMLTDLFVKNPQKYKDLLGSTFTLTDLMQYFIEEKFTFCYKDKCQYIKHNDFVERVFNGNRKYRVLQYETLALRTFLPQQHFDTLGINCDILEDIKGGEDDFGIVAHVDVANNTANFVHNVYGEYFVASWMSKNFDRVKNFQNFIFEEDFKNVRIMFDLIVAKGRPAHIAVLHKDFAGLYEHQNEVKLKDLAGRTPLHLICSWGQRYPLLGPKHTDGICFLEDCKNANPVKEDGYKYEEILKFLIEKIKSDPFEKDELFHWNSIEYADHALSLFPIEKLMEHHRFSIENLHNFSDLCSVSYYCIKLNFQEIFDNLKNIEYVVDSENKNTLLHMAVLHQRNSFLNKLFTNPKYQENIDETNCQKHYFEDRFLQRTITLESRQNPLHLAAMIGNNKAIQILSEKGAIIDVPDSNGNTALHLSVLNRLPASMMILLDRGANANAIDRNGDNILHHVTAFGDLNLINLVLMRKICICRNNLNASPLDIATIQNRVDILTAVIKKAITDDKVNITDLMVQSLQIASLRGQYDIVKCFIKHGADINRPYSNIPSPLFNAIIGDHIKVVELLLESGADPNIKIQGELNSFSFAVIGQHIKIAELLIEKKVDVKVQDIDGNTGLISAVICNNLELIKIILNNDVDVNHKNKGGASALHFAAKEGNVEVIKLLLGRGAEVNSTNNKRGTALHVAAYYRRNEAFNFLRENGAINKKAAKGLTPQNLMETLQLTYPFHVFPSSVSDVQVNFSFNPQRQHQL